MGVFHLLLFQTCHRLMVSISDVVSLLLNQKLSFLLFLLGHCRHAMEAFFLRQSLLLHVDGITLSGGGLGHLLGLQCGACSICLSLTSDSGMGYTSRKATFRSSGKIRRP